MRSEDLFFALNSHIDFDFSKNHFWWPRAFSFWVVIESILGQNTKYENAQKSAQNLQNAGVNSLSDIVNLSEFTLIELIKPSGFYNAKAPRLRALCKNILSEFGSFESFTQNVSREWLLSQKGIGFESADAILCYACRREIMVCDRYTANLMGFLGYEFETYDEMREWLENIDTSIVFGEFKNMSLNELYARFHGLIVEFCKAHLKGKQFDEHGSQILKNLI